MHAPSRTRFNVSFTPEKYSAFLRRLEERCGTPVSFRTSETPVFLPREIAEKLAAAGGELILRLCGDPAYLAASDTAVPAAYNAPNQDAHPLFICVDFGLTRDLEPKLVEIQGFPSLYSFQPALAETYREVYGTRGEGLLASDYWTLLRRAIIGEREPAEVALVEIDPFEQKTLPDFLLTRERLGIRIVNIRDIERRGRKLFADDKPIERIYNRAIVDELVRKDVKLRFDWRDDLDVEWAGHPNWYFRISKFSIPFLKHPSVPRTHFLHEVRDIPADLENWVLKPLYSFAGLGVKIGPSREDLQAVRERSQYILQERVEFAPLIETPCGPTKAEIRVMYLWLDDTPRPVTTIVRMGRGRMMGVDHNKAMEWVGASAGLVV